MGRKRVKKHQVSGGQGSTVPSTQSRKATQATISSFHTLLKRKAILERQRQKTPGNVDDIDEQLVNIEAQFQELGGIQGYQEASILGQDVNRGGDSSKVLINWLTDGAAWKGKQRDLTSQPLRLLEIGALTPGNYASCSTWIQNTPIDLRSTHPAIQEQDFFQRPIPTQWADHFDLISCSLVLNFVNDPIERGRMLTLVHRHLKPEPSSLLFLVLPLPCVINSKYLTVSHLLDIMTCVGFELIKERWKNGGKVGYWLFAWRQPKLDATSRRFGRKVQLSDGQRNNFCILLPSAES